MTKRTDKLAARHQVRRTASRRDLMRFALASPLAAGLWPTLRPAVAQEPEPAPLTDPALAKNVFQFEEAARVTLDADTYYFVADGADDMKTLRANREAFDEVQIRSRRLIDVTEVDTRLTLFGREMETPILLAPAGAQERLHEDGELATARAAAAKKHTMICSTMSSYGIGEIASAGRGPLWFQLYAHRDREVMKTLMQRAEAAGCEVMALSVDSAAFGNRERQPTPGAPARDGALRLPGNFEGLRSGPTIGDPTMTWDIIDWLRANTSMKILLKGIVTAEDAALCVERGADGLIVSNHGGRQEESNRGTLECLPEIVEAVAGRVPVLIDGGFRRGTDIFKAVAIGADAICIGRPYLWGLAAFGEDGVAKVLDILRAELVRIMKLTGIVSLDAITPAHITLDR